MLGMVKAELRESCVPLGLGLRSHDGQLMPRRRTGWKQMYHHGNGCHISHFRGQKCSVEWGRRK